VRLVADGDRPAEIRRPERRERREQDLPAGIPARHDGLARIRSAAFELAVAIAIGLLAVGRQKIGPSRAHIARHVLDDEGDAVGVGIQQREELWVFDLRHRLVGLRLQLSQLEDAIVKEVLFDQCAFSMWTR
jgi:hypothetical protein